MSLSGDAARVTVTVAAPRDLAFEVFTRETDLWWRRGPRFRGVRGEPGVIHFEAGVGGRLFESRGDGPAQTLVEMGKVIEWDPPAGLAFEWRSQAFAPGERTLVRVTFAASGDKTVVTVEHSGFAALRDDHPARHGLTGAAFARSLGMFWSDLMSAMREHVMTQHASGDDG